MKTVICRSCEMMLTKTSKGTDRDLKPAAEFWKHGYQRGNYTNPDLTLEEQIDKLVIMATANQLTTLPEALTMAEKALPRLKR